MVPNISNVLMFAAVTNILVMVIFYKLARWAFPKYRDNIYLIAIFIWYFICCLLINLSVLKVSVILNSTEY